MEYQDGWTLADAKAKYSDLLQSHHSLCWTVEILKDEKAKLLLQLGEAQDILASMLIAGEIDVHGEDPKCPQDDTCACPWAKKINAAMKGYAEEWKHSGPGLSPITEKPFNEKELKERLALIENGKCPECGQKVHLHNCTEKRKCECSCHPPNSQVQQCGACSGNHV